MLDNTTVPEVGPIRNLQREITMRPPFENFHVPTPCVIATILKSSHHYQILCFHSGLNPTTLSGFGFRTPTDPFYSSFSKVVITTEFIGPTLESFNLPHV